MTNEPRAGGGLDPEMLAAYIDKRLPPDERAVVEAKLAADPDSYELLVELIHANEALKDEAPKDGEAAAPAERAEPQGRTGAVVPMVPKPKRAGSWLIAGGVLAAAATLVLAVRLQPDLLQRVRGGDAVDPQLAKLVAAVGEERYIEARLSGDFNYGPLRSATRSTGDLSSKNLALLSVAGQLQKDAERQPTARNLHAWGAAQTLLGDHTGAVRTLTLAASIEGESADKWSDLGAAYLARGVALDAPEDVPVGLEQIERALSLDPLHAAALFNRAYALERMGIRDAEEAAWHKYLSVDSSSGWTAHARERLKVLTALPESSETHRILEGLLASSASSDASLQFAREHLEDEAINDWLAAESGEPRRSKGDIVLRAARSLATEQGDTLLLETLSGLTAEASSAHAVAVRRAFECHREARREYLRGNFAAVRDCEPLFADAGVPFSAWSRLYRARALGSSGRVAEALTLSREVLEHSGFERYPVLKAWAGWQVGGLAYMSGEYGGAVPILAQAAERFERAGEFENAASVRAALAAVYLAVGDRRQGWQQFQLAFSHSALRRPLVQSYATRTGIAQAALRAGLPRAARLMFASNLEFARLLPDSGMQAETQRNLAEASIATGDLTLAQSILRDAQSAAQLSAGSSHPSRSKAEFAWMQARLDALHEQPSAVESGAVAAGLFSQLGLFQRLVSVQVLQTEIARRQNRFDEAERLAQAAMATATRQEQSLSSSIDRAGYRGVTAALYREMARIRTARGDTQGALLAIEQLRRRELGRSGERDVRADLTLHPGTTAIVFLCDPMSILRWTITSDGVRFAELPNSCDQAVAPINRIHARVSSHAIGEMLTVLSGQLLAGIDSDLRTSDRLIVVPDGPLWSVPFAALPDEGTMLVDRLEVVMSTTVVGYANSRAATGSHVIGTTATVIASPRNDGYGLPALPASAQEGAHVAAIYQVTPYLESEATIDRFTEGLKATSIVHFAGHAVTDGTLPWRDHLVMAPSKLVPTGLLYQTDLEGQAATADLVVLAGCATASPSAEGVSSARSLASSLVAAGVPWVIGTLWEIDDQASSQVFGAIHQLIRRGESPAAAVRKVQQRLSRTMDTSVWASVVVIAG
ncbi:MAG: CHAT domain-containing protein [Vicinamibacterales bacterium]